MKFWTRLNALLLATLFSGCAGPDSKNRKAPPEGSALGTTVSQQLAEGISEEEIARLFTELKEVSLPQLVDLALRNNPRTRQFWFQSQADGAALGVEKAAYYPKLEAGVESNKNKASGEDSRTSSGIFATLDYLLFDFGERKSRVKAGEASWRASFHSHEASVQDVIFQTQTAYYQYVSLRFLARAQEATLKEAEANLDAARARSKAGVGTVTDALQAQTALSKVRLSLQSTQGQLLALRGAVFTAAGLPPSAPLDMSEVSWEDWPMEGRILPPVSEFLEQMGTLHPELLAARESLEQAKYKEKEAGAARLPSISISGRAEETRENGVSDSIYSTGIRMQFPLFAGGEYAYGHEKATAELALENEKYKGLSQAKALAVWTDYYEHETAKQQIQTANDLHASASESLEATLKRYREGAGSILDLLSAQSSLAEARAAQIQARADWLLSLAKLRHDVGILDRESSLK